MPDRPYDDDRISQESWVLDKMRDLGGIDLERTRRTIGFERRPLRADQRPRTAAAWGVMPLSWEE